MTNSWRLQPIVTMRWMARITAALAAGFILVVFVGSALSDGVTSLLRLTARETVLMLAFLIVWLGLLLGWRWELLGGAMVVVGMLVFYLLDYAFSGTFPRGITFPLLAFPGLLYLATAWLARREQSR